MSFVDDEKETKSFHKVDLVYRELSSARTKQKEKDSVPKRYQRWTREKQFAGQSRIESFKFIDEVSIFENK